MSASTLRRAAVVAAVVLGCAHASGEYGSNASSALPVSSAGSPNRPPNSPLMLGSSYVGERMLCIDRALEERGLNEYGDPPGTTYDKSPLWNRVTGSAANRYDYVVARHRDIGTACSRSAQEEER